MVAKPISFWGNAKVKPIKRSSVNPFWNTKPMTKDKYRRGMPVNLFGDRDKDGVMNVFDCQPRNNKKQDWQPRNKKYGYGPYSTKNQTFKTVKMAPDKFLRTGYQQAPEEYGEYSAYKKKLSAETFEGKRNVDVLKEKISSKKEKANIPYLRLGEYGAVIGHDGRHTSIAAEELGIKEMPVTLVIPKDKKATGKIEKEYTSMDKDTDGDGVVDYADCEPTNPKKQGWAHQGIRFNRERSTHIRMMSPEKFLRTTYIETTNRERPKGATIYPLYAKSYKDYSQQVISQVNVNELKGKLKDKNVKMDIPFLEYDQQGRPTGHEGRHRATAAKQLGVKLIPVTIARTLDEPRDWEKIRKGTAYEGVKMKGVKPTKKDWRNDLENTEEVISSKSADIPLEEQKEYGQPKPEALKEIEDKEELIASDEELIDKNEQ